MTTQAESTRLPNFESPPVTEVALSIQFAELVNFRAIHLGLLWDALGKDKFPSTEEQPPVANAVERVGGSITPNGPQIELLNIPPLPRVLFISGNGNLVVQIQVDRFTVNWRKRSATDVYPRYGAIQGEFEDAFRKLQNFLVEQTLGVVRVTQAEITYVNNIDLPEQLGKVEKIVSVYSGTYSDDFLSDPEEVRLGLRFPIQDSGKTLGRLYIETSPSISAGTPRSMNMLLLARGKPAGDDIKAALQFFTIARKYIVSAFASITSKQMHLVWKRREDA